MFQETWGRVVVSFKKKTPFESIYRHSGIPPIAHILFNINKNGISGNNSAKVLSFSSRAFQECLSLFDYKNKAKVIRKVLQMTKLLT